MSYDFYIEADVGGPEPLTNEHLYDADDNYGGNYTSNVVGIWAEAMGCPMADLAGKQCSDALPILRRGVEAIDADPDKYEAMNPENGWGDYRGAQMILKALAHNCELYPKATIGISR